MSIIIGVVTAVIIAAGLVRVFPETTERWLMRLLLARRILFGALVVIFALFLLATGTALLPVLGTAILVLVVTYLLLDPDNQLSDLSPL